MCSFGKFSVCFCTERTPVVTELGITMLLSFDGSKHMQTFRAITLFLFEEETVAAAALWIHFRLRASKASILLSYRCIFSLGTVKRWIASSYSFFNHFRVSLWYRVLTNMACKMTRVGVSCHLCECSTFFHTWMVKLNKYEKRLSLHNDTWRW